MSSPFRYPWPASCLGADDMALLFAARESSTTPTTITRLIRDAVRTVYGHLASHPELSSETERETPLRPAA